MSTPVMQVRLRADYGKRCVLTDVQFDLCAGEALGMVGTSGAGKSTLVMALLGLLPWRGGKASGEVLIDGCNLLTMPAGEARRIRGKKIAMVPQSPMTALNAAVSLRSHFEEAWRAHQSTGRKALESRLRELMHEVQLPPGDGNFLLSKPGQISVGQAQRVLIALALLHRPSILVADEPTSALDPITQADIIRLLRQLNRRHGTALLYISHDLLSVLQLCDRLAVLHSGAIAECLPVAQVEQAQHPATLSLLHALPVPVGVMLSHWHAANQPQHQSFRLREDVGFLHLQLTTKRHPERSASQIRRIKKGLRRGVEGPWRCLSYPCCSELFNHRSLAGPPRSFSSRLRKTLVLYQGTTLVVCTD